MPDETIPTDPTTLIAPVTAVDQAIAGDLAALDQVMAAATDLFPTYAMAMDAPLLGNPFGFYDEDEQEVTVRCLGVLRLPHGDGAEEPGRLVAVFIPTGGGPFRPMLQVEQMGWLGAVLFAEQDDVQRMHGDRSGRRWGVREPLVDGPLGQRLRDDEDLARDRLLAACGVMPLTALGQVEMLSVQAAEVRVARAEARRAWKEAERARREAREAEQRAHEEQRAQRDQKDLEVWARVQARIARGEITLLPAWTVFRHCMGGDEIHVQAPPESAERFVTGHLGIDLEDYDSDRGYIWARSESGPNEDGTYPVQPPRLEETLGERVNPADVRTRVFDAAAVREAGFGV